MKHYLQVRLDQTSWKNEKSQFLLPSSFKKNLKYMLCFGQEQHNYTSLVSQLPVWKTGFINFHHFFLTLEQNHPPKSARSVLHYVCQMRLQCSFISMFEKLFLQIVTKLPWKATETKLFLKTSKVWVFSEKTDGFSNWLKVLERISKVCLFLKVGLFRLECVVLGQKTKKFSTVEKLDKMMKEEYYFWIFFIFSVASFTKWEGPKHSGVASRLVETFFTKQKTSLYRIKEINNTSHSLALTSQHEISERLFEAPLFHDMNLDTDNFIKTTKRWMTLQY